MKMHEMLEEMPDDIEKALKIKQKIRIKPVENILVCGMGGSGISADILHDYLKLESKISIIVDKSYNLPAFVNKKTLVFILTYSGTTAETLSMMKEAKKRKAQIVVVTSGNIKENNTIHIPGGMLPRMALPYLFFPMLNTLENNGLIKKQGKNIKETISLLKKFDTKKAKAIADKIGKKTPVIYSYDAFSSVVARWKDEINENSKIIAHEATFTELNHNEINSMDFGKFAVIIIRDREDSGTKKQIEAAKKLIKNFTEVQTSGKSLLARMFYAIYFGDWVSYYVSENLKHNMEATPNINFVKDRI
ncbi:MAG TPA: bifunctional phosphoglucose/phosphomannose isomerase [archaeon]|nr:bifunctional phosphoglucose/phosphomannose isomerase [archaeon]